VDADRPAMTSAIQVIDVCALAQPGVACPGKHLFGRLAGFPRPRTLMKCKEGLSA
jgi:hypothetical protein